MANSLEELLGRLLDDGKFIICPSKNGAIKLEEPEISELEIYGLPPVAFAIKFGQNSQEWAFGRKKKEGYSRICDYLIFIPDKEKLEVVFCELKLGVDEHDLKRGGKQIVATMPLLSYFLAAINTHFDRKWEIVERYAIIGGRYKDISLRKWKLSLKGQRSEAPYEHQKNANKKIKINLFVGSADISINDIE